MSQENVEVVRRCLTAMAAADLEALLELCDPEVEYLPLTHSLVEGRGYRGHEGVREYFAEADELWHEMHPVADALRTSGDDVVVIGRCEFRGKTGEVGIQTPMAWVITIREGKMTRYRGFRTAAEALEAAGLTEE